MLPTRSLPPQFLLPSWSVPQLVVALQHRAYNSGTYNWKPDSRPQSNSHPPQSQPTPQTVTPPSAAERALGLFEELFPEEKPPEPPKEEVQTKKTNQLPKFRWERPGEKSSSAERQTSHKQLDEARGERRPLVIRRDPVESKAPFKRLEIGRKSNVIPPAYGTTIQKAVEEPRSAHSTRVPLKIVSKKKLPSVLLLSCAMKSLEETDFFRLNPRGDHIENWTSGIIGVIPDRDSHTLQKLDRYYILFSTPAAANRYLSNIIQLHQLARTSVQNGNAHGGLALPPGFLKHGEDVRGVLKGFSVVPPFTKLSCRLVSHPYPLPLQRLLENGGPAILAGDKQSKIEEKVLFYTDTLAYGDLTLDTLYHRIKEDGRRRNLHWKLAGSKEDIRVLKEGHNQVGDEGYGTGPKINRTPTRYVIPFTDRHEARRFVREWHRRELPLKKVYRPEDEPPPLVNAEILW